jgi:1-phosphatidylinositol phosphodiesterase
LKPICLWFGTAAAYCELAVPMFTLLPDTHVRRTPSLSGRTRPTASGGRIGRGIVLLALATILGPSASADSVPNYPDKKAYSNDSNTGVTNTDWMASLPDSKLLSELSIPGTHDSGAYSRGGPIAFTQKMDIPAQLNAGIRALDVRMGTGKDDLRDDCSTGWFRWHGLICQGGDGIVADVFYPVYSFLSQHFHETVVMRVKNDNGNAPSNYAQIVSSMLEALSETGFVYKGGSQNPTLGEVRGKIVVMNDFTDNTNPGDHCLAFPFLPNSAPTNVDCYFPDVATLIPWSSLYKQDNYDWPFVHNIYDKWTGSSDPTKSIKAQFDAADKDDGGIYVNFLSGSSTSIGFYPYTFASGKTTAGTTDPQLDTFLTGSY